MREPFFSIIVPTYNREKFIGRCIQSVLDQTFIDWELIIIDDGSTDGTKNTVKQFAYNDQRIKYFYQTNQKVSAARNLGLANANGKYLCFLDSDDKYDSDHLQLFFDFLKARNFPNIFLSTAFRYNDGISEQIFPAPAAQNYADAKTGRIMSVYLPYSPCVQTICIPGVIKEMVKFDKRLYLSECYDFNARAAACVDEVIYFPRPTVTLYGHTDNASVPVDVSGILKFNSRQYQEFQLMSKEAFYKRIATTDAFKKRLFHLQLELVKWSLRSKNLRSFVPAFFGALRHDPFFLFRINYKRMAKKIKRKLRPVPAI